MRPEQRASDAFFERAVTIHRFNCRAVGTGSGDNDFETPEAVVDTLMPSEAAVRYGLESRPVYDGLRRLAGHLAGLLILVEVGGGRRILDLPDLRAAADRLAELTAALARLRPPSRLEPHFAELQKARCVAETVLQDLGALGMAGANELRREAASHRLRELCAILKSASEPRIGLMMVDLRQACCTCAGG